MDAFYRRLIDAPDAARRRAQAAYVIASAFGAAILGAGALSNFEQSHPALKILGPTVVVAWLVSAALFLWAVAVPADPNTPKQAEGFDEFREAVLTSHFDEQREIDRRQFWARGASALGATLAMTTVVLVLVLDNPPRDVQATLRLHADARRDLTRICAKPIPPVIRGKVDEASLADGTVDVKLENGTCSDGAETAVWTRTRSPTSCASDRPNHYVDERVAEAVASRICLAGGATDLSHKGIGDRWRTCRLGDERGT